MIYDNLKNLIDNLHKNFPYDISSVEIADTVDKFEVWTELLKYLKQEGLEIGHYPFWESDLKADSLLEGISQECDYDTSNEYEIDVEQILQQTSTAGTTIWNESLYELIEDWLKLKKTEEQILPSSVFTFNDIKKADAGYSFETEPYVIPWKNIDKEAYTLIRDKDAVQSVLLSNRNLQFTHKFSDSATAFLRLIMPKYTRRVEVEDLDRNFWVIGQVVSAISQYLFDNESPLLKVFKETFNELVQIWENILYLWGELGLLTKEYYPIRVLYLPMPNNRYCHYKKYDNFGAAATEDYDTIKGRCEYLVDKYSKNNLIIIPFVREDNYRKNYYSIQSYPYILFYDRYKKAWSYTKPTCNSQPLKISVTGKEIKTEWGTHLYAIREISGLSYKYCSPCIDAEEEIKDENGKFYGMIRIKPNIKARHNGTSLEITSLQLNLYDAAYTTVRNSDRCIATISNTIPITGNNSICELVCNVNSNEADVIAPTKISFARGEAYYLGEVVSGYAQPIKPLLTNADFKVIKIGDFYPNYLLKKGENTIIAGVGKDIPGQPADVPSIQSLVKPPPADLSKRVQGCFYPVNQKTVPKSGDNILPYDWDTYGYGSYYCYYPAGVNGENLLSNSSLNINTADKELKFCSYYDFSYRSAKYVSPEFMKYLGKKTLARYIWAAIQEPVTTEKITGISSKACLYGTKSGIGYWTGLAGSQWNYGIVNDIFFYPGYDKDKDTSAEKVEERIEHLGAVNLFDGYWTLDQNVFTVHDNQWRSLRLYCASFLRRTKRDDVTYSMKGGKLVWNDHNLTVYEGKTQTISSRPHCDMNITKKNGEYTLTFSNPVNPITQTDGSPGDTDMAVKVKTRVVNEVHHITSYWKEDNSKLMMNSKPLSLSKSSATQGGAADWDIFYLDATDIKIMG